MQILDIEEQVPLIEKIISINRCAKVTKGGKKLSFSALVVVGDGKGQVGVALGKANEVADAIRKGISKAKKNMVKINLEGNTIPYELVAKFSASKIILKPASPGTGIIACGPIRAICEAVGIKDILSKSLKSNNPINIVKATLKALQSIKKLPLNDQIGLEDG
ncbi:MAG: 30S ribosomal protein S5, partial [Candidatus Omnitrophica bacterium]|nr:30S ribosomal protein S5 [Candidatus Omnitrophota bacterium]